MKTELHVLTKDTPNPAYDKRCKYGLRAKKYFANGTIVTTRTGMLSEMLSMEIDLQKDREITHVWINRNMVDRELADTILANCELLDERTLTIDQLFNMYDVPGNAVVRALVNSGKLSMMDLHDTLKELQ